MKQSLMRLGLGLCKIYLMHEPHLSIGRDAACDLVLDDELASRKHARIEVTEAATSWVVDTDSLNGVLVNNSRIAGARSLKHLDVITIGRARFRFFEATTYRDTDLGISS